MRKSRSKILDRRAQPAESRRPVPVVFPSQQSGCRTRDAAKRGADDKEQFVAFRRDCPASR